jgi:hypothetical protein
MTKNFHQERGSGDGGIVETSEAGRKTRRRQAERYSWRLVLTIAGSVLGALVPGLVGTGPIATLVATILVALFSAIFTGEGPATRPKVLAALVLTLVAVILTYSGFTLVELVRGKSVLGDREFTFPVPAPLSVERQAVSTPKQSTPSTSSSNSDPNTFRNPDAPSARDVNSPGIPGSLPPAPKDPNPPDIPASLPPAPKDPNPPVIPAPAPMPQPARTEGEIQVYDWTYQDYRTKYDQLWSQGWRLKLLTPYVVNNQVRYTAVWHPST